MPTKEAIRKYAKELGEVVAAKNEQYGNSVVTSARVLEVLYPSGVTTDQYQDLLLVVRILDKLSRIAHGADTEDPYADIGGYGVLGHLTRK